MEFKRVADVFEAISKISGRLEITRLLAALFKEATPAEIQIIANLALGLLRPPYQGTQFNFAEKSLIKVIAQLTHQTEAHTAAGAKKLGDLGSVLEQGQWHEHKKYMSLAVERVYRALVALENINGAGSQEEKAKSAVELLTKLDPSSAKYVVRIMLGTLRLGFSDMTLIDALSWMVTSNKSLREPLEDAYNSCVDIGLIAYTLKKEGIQAIKHMNVHIGIPIRPAAAERLPTARAIIEKLGPCVAQPKLDGFRLQIHLLKKAGKKPEVHFFSRNLQDMSAMFPDVINDIIKLPAHELIVEGEAIVFDETTGNFLPFQETVKRKRKHGIEQAANEYPLKVFLFDVLYLNGHSTLSKTHEERRVLLLDLVKQLKSSSVEVIEEKKVTSAQKLEDYFNETVAVGLEGLVVKRPDAIYQPGKRNFNWIKLKRHEEGHLEDTIDAVILGYYAGSGKRAHFGIGAFLVGLYNKREDAFQTVAKVGSGLKDEQWRELRKKCDSVKIDHKPYNVVCAKELYPDVWITPAIVCAIRADEITLSPLHSAGKTKKHLGYALRFPRFIDYRPDKSAEDATTITEIERLYKDQFETIK
jgi:DNA ligase-1